MGPETWAMGVDLGGTKVEVAAVDAGGNILQRLKQPTRAETGPESIMAAIADMVRQVGGDRVHVTVVVPPGASPHTFELKPAMVQAFSASRLFFMVGAGLEFWANSAVRSSGKSLETVVLSDDMPLIQMVGHHHDKHKQKANDQSHHESANPHVWLDPVLAKQKRVATPSGAL